MSWGGYGHIVPGDILVLKDNNDDTELTRNIVLSSHRMGHISGQGSEIVHTLYTIYNSDAARGLSFYNVGRIFTLTRKQMINDYTAVWSKLC